MGIPTVRVKLAKKPVGLLVPCVGSSEDGCPSGEMGLFEWDELSSEASIIKAVKRNEWSLSITAVSVSEDDEPLMVSGLLCKTCAAAVLAEPFSNEGIPGSWFEPGPIEE